MESKPLVVKLAPLNAKIIVPALLACVLLLFASLFLVRPEIRFREVLRKYPPGTTAQRILADYGPRAHLVQSGNVPVEIDARVKQEHVFYICRLPEADAEIHFNFYQQVVRIRKISALRGEPK